MPFQCSKWPSRQLLQQEERRESAQPGSDRQLPHRHSLALALLRDQEEGRPVLLLATQTHGGLS